MDALDSKILAALMGDGRMTWAELALALDLSAPAAAERVRRLVERGAIRGFTALVDAQAAGCPLLAFVAVTLRRPQDRPAFLALVESLDEVQECHHVAGDDDYVLKVRCRDTAHLEVLVTDRLKGLRGVTRTRTSIALATLKETTRLPLEPPDAAPGRGAR